MRSRFFWALICAGAVLIMALSVVLLRADEPADSPVQGAGVSPAPLDAVKVNARAAYLLAGRSHTPLVAQNADTQLAPASLVKMMTLRLAFKALRDGRAALDDLVPVSVKAWRTPGSRMFIREGELVPFEELLKGIAVVSGNDACVAVAEFLSGTEEAFVAEMNEEAKRLGLTGTHFVDSHGISDANKMTARDAAVLGLSLIEDFPEVLRYTSQREFTFGGVHQFNRNGLLFRDEAVDGIKTGHTEEAGWSLVASGLKDGMRLVAVVMGAPDGPTREREAARLLRYGFLNFVTVKAAEAGKTGDVVRVFAGKRGSVPVELREAVFVTVRREAAASVTVKSELPDGLVAPVEKGQQVGIARILAVDTEIASRPLVAAENIGRAGFLKVALDSLRLFFLRLFTGLKVGPIGE